ncbi:MAG: zincin-like metallopeptidase domain-containing protein [Myxococcota bacterium]|jgi:antirestriction protein ArdC|nr:zincin-like metallopeptidase domain-containing protein [Myxococcota bacterium]
MSQQDLYRETTDRILLLLDQGIAPWHKPWSGGLLAPRNLHGGRRYQGFNRLLLAWAAYDCCYWVTGEQARKRGWQVREGEQPWPVIGYFWPPNRVPPRPSLVGQQVFNLRQLDGIVRLPRPRGAALLPVVPPIEQAEAIVAGMPRRPEIRTGSYRACYRPAQDLIEMPPRDHFESGEAFYSTLFHELVHATAHPDRLDRQQGWRTLRDDWLHDYSFEELVAEFGAAFLCAHTGIVDRTLDNSVAYIRGWRKRLDANPRWVVQAAGLAAHAVDYVLGVHPAALLPDDAEILRMLPLVDREFPSVKS